MLRSEECWSSLAGNHSNSLSHCSLLPLIIGTKPSTSSQGPGGHHDQPLQLGNNPLLCLNNFSYNWIGAQPFLIKALRSREGYLFSLVTLHTLLWITVFVMWTVCIWMMEVTGTPQTFYLGSGTIGDNLQEFAFDLLFQHLSVLHFWFDSVFWKFSPPKTGKVGSVGQVSIWLTGSSWTLIRLRKYFQQIGVVLVYKTNTPLRIFLIDYSLMNKILSSFLPVVGIAWCKE